MGVIHLTPEEIQDVFDSQEKEISQRAVAMPTEQDAIDAMLQAYQRLKELGWNDTVYCPKDGTVFDVIEPGSSGVHSCTYDGEWPKGSWWVHDEHDMYPSRPVLFKLKKD